MAVEIVEYSPQYREAFYTLNAEWIEAHFRLEEGDLGMMKDPEMHVINPGGQIFFAVEGDIILGTCGVMKLADNRFELIKMGVTEAARGRRIGYQLIEAAIAYAKVQGGTAMVLETNSVLTAAIALYEKMGFEHIALERIDGTPVIERADVMMQLTLSEADAATDSQTVLCSVS